MVAAVLRLRGCTPYEKLVLLALAEDTRRGTRTASPGLKDDAASPGMLTRTGLSRSRLYKVRQELGAPAVDKDGTVLRPALVRSVSPGRKYRRAVYELLFEPYDPNVEEPSQPSPPAEAEAPPGPSQPPPPADAEPSQASPPADPEAAPQPPPPADAEVLRVRDTSSQGPQDVFSGSARQGPLPEVPPGSTSLSLRAQAPADKTEREPTGAEDTFGTRAVAALGRDDLTARQLDTLHDRVAGRIGLGFAAHAVHALLTLAHIRNHAAYVSSLSNDELRELAEQHREQWERKARPTGETRPKCDDPTCGPSRRLEDPDDGSDRGPCPNCSFAFVGAA